MDSIEYKLPPIQLPSAYQEEKPKKQRTSHNMIEKRRREKMNDKIEKLKALIPSCTSQFPIKVQQPMHKLTVLQAAVEYIKELHKELEKNLPKDDPLRKDLEIVLLK